MNKKYFLALDIGGTKTSGAVFTKLGDISDGYVYVTESKTYEGEEEVYQNTKNVILHLLRYFELDIGELYGIGVGCPGPLDASEGVIINAPMMRWKDFPLVEKIKKDFKTEVVLDNDGNLGALAEQRAGVAKGKRNVLYMTVSTGCGGGLIADGKIYHGMRDCALEVGHMCIDACGSECECGGRGCFELYASGTAINRYVNENLHLHKDSILYSEAVLKKQKISGKIILEAAEAGDAFAVEVYKREGRYLGIGLVNLFNLFDPDMIVLGGGVTKAKEFFHDEMMAVIEERCIIPVESSRIGYSQMNDRVVLYGAYYLISDFYNSIQGDGYGIG